MSSGIPTWLTKRLKNYQTYNLDDLSFHSSLCIKTKVTQTGGGLFKQPQNVQEYRNVIKNTILKELDDNTRDYFD